MAQEIERKYLLDADVLTAPALKKYYGKSIQQAYLSEKGAGMEIRARIAERDGETKATLTIKTGKGFLRTEFEYPVPVFEAQQLINGCANNVEKTRYDVGRVELDVYHDNNAGLVVAEIELTSETEEVEFPAWLRPYVVREVTGEPAYANAVLARNLHPTPSSPSI